MSAHSRVDRESFQNLLANAFALQESGIGTQSLSALFELQRFIATGEPDMDRILHHVANRTRNVANATGTAIALLRGDRLVYRAGSGCAATYVGRNMTAILRSSAHNQARGEILRVENAQTDPRIEAAICRQFGANSLLILPIYRERAVAGVLEVLFDEAHVFQERELRTYRLMIGLVEESMFRDARLDHKTALATGPTSVPHAIEMITSQTQKLHGDDKSTLGAAPKHGTGQACGVATAVAGKVLDARQPAKAAKTITLRVERASLDKFLWSVAAAGAITALGIAGWIAYDHRPASRVDASVLQRSNAAELQVLPVSAKPLPTHLPRNPQSAGSGTEATKAARSAFKRAGAGRNEVDHEDVAVRRFTTRPSPPQVLAGDKQVNFGDDVTVRYFAYKLGAGSQTRPVSPTAQSVERSLPLSK